MKKPGTFEEPAAGQLTANAQFSWSTSNAHVGKKTSGLGRGLDALLGTSDRRQACMSLRQ